MEGVCKKLHELQIILAQLLHMKLYQIRRVSLADGAEVFHQVVDEFVLMHNPSFELAIQTWFVCELL